MGLFKQVSLENILRYYLKSVQLGQGKDQNLADIQSPYLAKIDIRYFIFVKPNFYWCLLTKLWHLFCTCRNAIMAIQYLEILYVA